MEDTSATSIPFTLSGLGLLWKIEGRLSYNHAFCVFGWLYFGSRKGEGERGGEGSLVERSVRSAPAHPPAHVQPWPKSVQRDSWPEQPAHPGPAHPRENKQPRHTPGRTTALHSTAQRSAAQRSTTAQHHIVSGMYSYFLYTTAQHHIPQPRSWMGVFILSGMLQNMIIIIN